MTKGLPRSQKNAKKSNLAIVKQTFKVKDSSLSVDGATGVGFGTSVIGDLPEGNILFLGAVSYLQFSSAAAGITATFDGDYSIGTVPTADTDVSDAGEANIIPSTALGAATAKVSPIVRGTQSDGSLAGVVLDNTDGSLELNLNLLIDDAAISADDVIVLANGTVTVSYVVLSDD